MQSSGTMTKWDDRRPTSPYGSPSFSEHTSFEHASFEPSDSRGSVPSPLPDYIISDILAYVQHALGRFAAPGEVRYSDSHIYIDNAAQVHASPVSIAAWSRDWSRMDEALRRRRAEEVARALCRERLVSAARAPAPRVIYLDVKLFVALGVLALCAVWITFGEDRLPNTRANEGISIGSVESGSRDPSSRATSEPRSTKESLAAGADLGEARSSRVCGATLSRIFQGGSVSVADVDGFRVEIALLKEGARQPIDTDPVLARFVQAPGAATGSRFIWKEEVDLAPVQTSDSVVVVRRIVLGEGDARIFGATLSFGGTLVDPYFKEADRSRYFHIASALADAVSATHVAVYARCFDRAIHALGGWFRGRDTGAAISSLVYFMGTYAKPIHLAKPYYQIPGEQDVNRLHAFKSISQKTAPLTRNDLATLIGNEGGMATGRAGEQVIITFPFGDGNRASRASRSIVRVTGLGL